MPDSSQSVLDGSTFVVSDRLGDVSGDAGSGEHGFFSDDTRFISRWVLRVGDAPLELLGLDQSVHFAAQYFLSPRVRPDEQVPCSIMRRRVIDHVWLEEITVVNHRHEAVEIDVRLEADSDFADLFEVKDGAVRERVVEHVVAGDSLTLSYSSGEFTRSAEIVASCSAEVTRSGFRFRPQVEPGEQWSVTVTVIPHEAQPGVRFSDREPRGGFADLTRAKSAELETWLARAPQLESESQSIMRTYRASLGDLGALRLHPDLAAGATLPAAGLPWFMALFGRDSIITSLQALPYIPELAATTLRVLAAHQATTRDDFHEQEPGKILHELRFGELTASGERPHSPYFGSADATPLFLVLLDEYERWTRDDALVRELEPHARAAIAWIDASGDADGDGYVEYFRRNDDTGLLNQCWKDSWDSMQFADGSLARGPISTCEIQGYVYDALQRCARLAREAWDDPPFAQGLEQRAERLRAGFRRDFWMPGRNCPALALDGTKRQVDSLTSNIGHLLWSGILDEDEAAATAEHLMGEQLYSGWGVRTLGTREAGYNPLGYHTGTVWPHENALIAAGLARYGHRDAALRLAGGILAAAPYFEHRLPEVFAGYPASQTTVPVAFPTASRPQAWAAGAPLMLLTTLLELQPGRADADVELGGALGRMVLRR